MKVESARNARITAAATFSTGALAAVLVVFPTSSAFAASGPSQSYGSHQRGKVEDDCCQYHHHHHHHHKRHHESEEYYRGPQGYQGRIGARGPQGYQGSTGTQGPQGFRSATGAQGVAGFQGFQGVQGSIGFQGTPGPNAAASIVVTAAGAAGTATTAPCPVGTFAVGGGVSGTGTVTVNQPVGGSPATGWQGNDSSAFTVSAVCVA